MQAVKQYFFAVTAVCFAVSVLLALLPDGAVKRVMILAGGIAILLVCVRPLLHADLPPITALLQPYAAELPAISMTEENDALLRDIISDRCASYILDKAKRDGIALHMVSVDVSSERGICLPASAELRGQFTEQQKNAMCAWISDAIGIGAEGQTWIWE